MSAETAADQGEECLDVRDEGGGFGDADGGRVKAVEVAALEACRRSYGCRQGEQWPFDRHLCRERGVRDLFQWLLRCAKNGLPRLSPELAACASNYAREGARAEYYAYGYFTTPRLRMCTSKSTETPIQMLRDVVTTEYEELPSSRDCCHHR